MKAIAKGRIRRLIAKNGGALAAILTSLIVFVSANSKLLSGADAFIVDQRFAAMSNVIESNSVVVGIDSKSLLELPDWPWSRDVHARLVDALNKHGAAQIAFDIDFSAPNNREGNRAFRESLVRSRAPVHLAAFRQQLSEEMPNIITEILPHMDMRDSSEIASVDFVTEANGTIRRALDGSEFSFGMVPSFSYALTQKKPIGEFYYIDYAIAPESINLISYVDVLNGHVDPAQIEGKTVFVGALAVELGDEYVIPNRGSVSGVVINALAYETVRLNRQLKVIGSGPVLLATLLLIFILLSRPVRAHRNVFTAVNLLVLVVSVVAPLELQRSANIILPTGVLHFGQLICVAWALGFELEHRARVAFRSQMAAKDNHVLLQSLVSENHEGIIVVNRAGVIELVNSRAESLLNLPGPSVVQKTLKEVEPRLVEGLDFEHVQTGGIKNFVLWDSVEVDEGGRAMEVTVSRSVVPRSTSRFERRSEDRIFMVFTLHDLTEQKKLEKAERRAKEAFAALSEAKTQLISNMSHELRTPLNSIIGFSDVLLSTPIESLGTVNSQEYLSMINRGGRQLLLVLNDMLFASNIQAGNLELMMEELVPEDFIESAVSELKRRASWDAQKISVDLDADIATLRVDLASMKLALVHLLDNAAKFGGANEEIELTFAMVSDSVTISVRDNGPGCPQELLSGLATMFGQGDQALSRAHEGCGLGLYLARSIVELHEGTLRFESSPGKGFKATISLPLTRAASRTKAA